MTPSPSPASTAEQVSGAAGGTVVAVSVLAVVAVLAAVVGLIVWVRNRGESDSDRVIARALAGSADRYSLMLEGDTGTGPDTVGDFAGMSELGDTEAE
jgi:hypothetical protein